MGRIVSFDLDNALAKLKTIADDGPQMLQMAEAAGWGGAAKVSPFLPMAAPLAMMLGKLLGGSDGLTNPSLPDTGPRGRGRLKYLREGSAFADADVVRACELVTTAGLPQSKTVAETINFTLRCMFPDTPRDKWTDAQQRAAIDRVLGDDGLAEGTCDKLGDMIYYALTNGPRGQNKEE